MKVEPNIATVAALIADPARAMMLTALLDGRALPAGELAYAAGISAQSASNHLARLIDGNLVSVEREGRHRYYRLAGPLVATALEGLTGLTSTPRVLKRPVTPEAHSIRFARSCYDHLAGELGVALAGALQRARFIAPADEKLYRVTKAGWKWFEQLGIERIEPGRRPLARQCLDWTERRHHVAGALGGALLTRLCALGWTARIPQSRAIRLTPLGRRELKKQLGLALEERA